MPTPQETLTELRADAQAFHDKISRALGEQTTAEKEQASADALATANGKVSGLQAQLDAANTKIENARVAAQAEKDADSTHVAGQGILDALA